MHKITEIIPDSIPDWAKDAMDEGQFFRIALERTSSLEAHNEKLRSRLCPMCEGVGMIGAMTAEGGDAVDCPECEGRFREDVYIPPKGTQFSQDVADEFWSVWNRNGETHKHGFYESTWMAIWAALKVNATIAEKE